MPKPRQIAPAVTLLLLVGALALGITESGALSDGDSTRLWPESGRVTFAEGGVFVRRDDGAWQPLYAGDRVRPGDSLRTEGDGRAEMSWERPRRVMRIERTTVVALAGRVAGSRLLMAGARVSEGAAWANARESRRPFTLEAPHLDARTDGATASVRAGDDASRLAVYRGEARAGGRVLKAGEGLRSDRTGVVRFAVTAEDDLRDGWRDVRGETAVAAPAQPHEETLPETTRLTRDLRDLSPEIYLGVEVELTGTEEARGFEADAARIRKIKVRADVWDAMQADRKVTLLNDTFDILKERYPGILETMVLEFDDARPRLSLKYAHGRS